MNSFVSGSLPMKMSHENLWKMFRYCYKIELVLVFMGILFSSADIIFPTSASNGHCWTPCGKIGMCKNIKDCEPLFNLLIKGKSRPRPRVIDYLRRSHCGFEGKDPVVCCPVAVEPKDNRTSLKLELNNQRLEKFLNKSCGSVDSTNRIFGGEQAAPHEFPWMALIGYITASGLDFRCAGSLISSRYVLTAAHCVVRLKDIIPKIVRLGEHNLNSTSSSGKDTPIEEIISHPAYGGYQNDIALIRLSKPVGFKDSIRPICLPIQKDISERGLKEEKAVVAGWGATESGVKSQVLKKIILPIVPNEECSKVYGRKITDSQICAGGEAREDSCKGDSGGPLQKIGLNPAGDAAYILLGIVSFGSRVCGVRGFPGVYTKVSRYVDWIAENLKE